jgi:hypothetical protein
MGSIAPPPTKGLSLFAKDRIKVNVMARIAIMLLALVLLVQPAMAGVCVMAAKCAPTMVDQSANHSMAAHHHGHTIQSSGAATVKMPACGRSVKVESKAALRDSNQVMIGQEQQPVVANFAQLPYREVGSRPTRPVRAPIVVPLRI